MKIKNYSYMIVFLTIVLGLGFLSTHNLFNFYINQELDYNEWSPELGTKFETDIASTFYNKFGFVNLNGAISNFLDQPSMNNITKLKNGHLISPQGEMSDKYVRIFSDEVIKYADYCTEHGKQFLFVQTMLKVDPDNKQLPVGVEDYSNENVDIFLGHLKESGVDVLDIRECMKEDGLDMYDYTYVTDHHWTTLGAFYTFGKITQWVEKKTGVAADPRLTDINQYEIKTYPKWHLGSYGQRVGEYYAGVDDYDLILPKFDVYFIDENGAQKTYYEQVVNTDVFEKLDVTSRYTYDHALKNPDGTVATTSQKLSVLLLSDSYSVAINPFMGMAYSDYHKYSYPEGFYADYISKYDPDVIILMPYYTSTFDGEAIFIDK